MNNYCLMSDESVQDTLNNHVEALIAQAMVQSGLCERLTESVTIPILTEYCSERWCEICCRQMGGDIDKPVQEEATVILKYYYHKGITYDNLTNILNYIGIYECYDFRRKSVIKVMKKYLADNNVQ